MISKVGPSPRAPRHPRLLLLFLHQNTTEKQHRHLPRPRTNPARAPLSVSLALPLGDPPFAVQNYDMLEIIQSGRFRSGNVDEMTSDAFTLE